jgi:hypothetical protein
MAMLLPSKKLWLNLGSDYTGCRARRRDESEMSRKKTEVGKSEVGAISSPACSLTPNYSRVWGSTSHG